MLRFMVKTGDNEAKKAILFKGLELPAEFDRGTSNRVSYRYEKQNNQIKETSSGGVGVLPQAGAVERQEAERETNRGIKGRAE